MRDLFRPRSIARLTLMGLGVTLTPLIAAVVTGVIRVDQLSQDYRVAVLQAEVATQQGRSLVQNVTEMRRALGQYWITDEQRMYEAYRARRNAFRNAAENLTGLDLSEPAEAELGALLREEHALFERFGGESDEPAEEGATDEATAAWSGLETRARTVLAASSEVIADQANLALRAADSLQRDLLLLAAAVIPVSLILAALFVASITRPMRGLSSAIRGLGGPDLSKPIRITGPRDIEDLGRQLDWLRQRLNELEHQKLTFLRHISHELKTPLTTLREGSELLVESLADAAPEEAEISRLMQLNSVRLQKLIEDLLQFGKSQQPLAKLTLEPGVRLDALVEEAVAGQSVAAAAKELEIVSGLEPLELTADASKLRIVIDNLLTNAIKYTPPCGQVRIDLARSGEFAQLDVQDTGPGIGCDEAEAIFEPFVQGSARYESSVKGTGLGLAIARDYVESHDGRIEVVASERGAHLRVTLRLAGPENVAAAA